MHNCRPRDSVNFSVPQQLLEQGDSQLVAMEGVPPLLPANAAGASAPVLHKMVTVSGRRGRDVGDGAATARRQEAGVAPRNAVCRANTHARTHRRTPRTHTPAAHTPTHPRTHARATPFLVAPGVAPQARAPAACRWRGRGQGGEGGSRGQRWGGGARHPPVETGRGAAARAAHAGDGCEGDPTGHGAPPQLAGAAAAAAGRGPHARAREGRGGVLHAAVRGRRADGLCDDVPRPALEPPGAPAHRAPSPLPPPPPASAPLPLTAAAAALLLCLVGRSGATRQHGRTTTARRCRRCPRSCKRWSTPC